MIPSNFNRCRFEILEIINRLEGAQLSQSRITSSVSVGAGKGIVGRRRRVASWTYPDSGGRTRDGKAHPSKKLCCDMLFGRFRSVRR